MTPEAFEIKNFLILLSVIIFSICANLFAFYSLKWEKVTNVEPARILEPLFIVILAVLFSFFVDSTLYERKLHLIIPAFIAGVALIFSHVKKHHITFNKYFIAAILGSFFFALELVMSRLILDYYSPVSFYFIRCSAIFLISLAIFKPATTDIKNKTGLMILITGLIWFIYRIVIYYGYQHYGIVFTTLMIMLGPIFIYAFAYKFLKEKINWRNIAAAVVILACVLYASWG
jgi:drug/metabolite transporter (DMT)-like permease